MTDISNTIDGNTINAIKDKLQNLDYGILMIFLKEEYSYSGEGGAISVTHTGGNHDWVSTNLSGMYRNNHQMQDDYFSLEVIRGREVRIPYDAIDSVERLRELPAHYREPPVSNEVSDRAPFDEDE